MKHYLIVKGEKEKRIDADCMEHKDGKWVFYREEVLVWYELDIPTTQVYEAESEMTR